MAVTDLSPPPQKQDPKFDNWMYRLWLRARASVDFATIGATSPILATTGTGTIGLSHATSGVVAGTYGGASAIPVMVVNTYGHVTSGTTTAFVVAGTSVTGADLSLTSPIIFSTGTGTNILLRSANIAHATSGITPGTYGGASSIPQVVVDTYGHVTAINTFAPAAGSALTLGTRVITTSGTQALFSGIASGAKLVQVAFDNFSMSGTGHTLVQLGDAGGIEANAYQSLGAGAGLTATSTAGFLLYMNAATGTFVGRMDLMLQNSAAFTWVEAINGYYPSASAVAQGAGVKSLSAELTQLRVISSGTDTFDAGSINILYG